jgi:hypothetical protein
MGGIPALGAPYRIGIPLMPSTRIPPQGPKGVEGVPLEVLYHPFLPEIDLQNTEWSAWIGRGERE